MVSGLAGCSALLGSRDRKAPTTWERITRKLNPVNPDDLEVHYIFIERELDSHEINDVLWAEADEQALAIEQVNDLRDNGLRLATIGSRLSPKVEEMLKKANDSGKGFRQRTRAGDLIRIQATENLPHWSLFTFKRGQAKGQEIEDGQGFLNIVPSIAGETAVRLSVVPVIEFGQRVNKRTPSRDLSGWQMRSERESRVFEEIRFPIDLESGDYFLLGCNPERKGTIGCHFFTRLQSGKTWQTVLLGRVIRPSREELIKAGHDPGSALLADDRSLRAGRSIVRETLVSEGQRDPKRKPIIRTRSAN